MSKRPVNIDRPLGLFVAVAVGVLADSKRHSLCLYGVFRELVLVCVLF